MKRPSPWIQVLIAASTLMIIAAAFFLSAKTQRALKDMAVEEFNRQQLILARSAVNSIEIYFKALIGEISTLADLPEVQLMTSEGKEFLSQAYWGFPRRTSIRVLDQNGVLRFIYPRTGWRKELVGKNYSDKEYIRRAMETGRITLSSLVYNEKGEARIRIAVPIYPHETTDELTENVQKGTPLETFNEGVLVGSLDPAVIARNFISPIVSGKTGYAWLLDSDGVFISHQVNEFVGKNAFSIRRTRNPLFAYDAIAEIQHSMMSGAEGKGRYVSGWHRDREGELEKLVAYSPAEILDKVWSVAVCAPVSEVEEIVNRAQRAERHLLTLVVCVLLLCGSFFLTTSYRRGRFLELEVSRQTKNLKETQERYRLTFENMGNAFAVFEVHGDGADFIFKDYNKAAEKIDHMDREKVIGKSVLKVFPRVSDYGLLDVYKRVWATGKPEQFSAKEYLDGHISGWREYFVYKLPSGEIVSVYKDETDREKAKMALEANEKRMRAMVNASPAGICLFVDRKAVQLNRAMYRMIGYEEGELLGEHVQILYPDREEYERVGRELYVAADASGIGIIETRLVRKDGSFLDCYVQACAVDLSDPSQGHMVVVLDISEKKNHDRQKKELEDRLRQAEKMESIGALAGGIAHDFNNILFPIMGYTEVLLKDAPEGGNLHELLERILKAADRAKDLVRQILTFSRQGDEELQPIRLQPSIKEALKLIRASIPTTIEIRQFIANGNAVAMANPTRIHQIVMNLCTNAYHAMEQEGGELTVSLREAELTNGDCDLLNLNPGLYLELAISDTGKGMKPEVLKRIFEPYYTTKAIGKGTGMGLSVVYGIVKEFGGEIRVNSKPGEGTRFRVYLPAIHAVENLSGESGREGFFGGTERILLVDDDKDTVFVQKEMLKQLGYSVTHHTNSLAALAAFRRDPNLFDMVITDLTMPNLTGDKLSRELSHIRPEVPIVLCTGSNESMSEERAVRLGITGFFEKPIKINELAHMVRRTLENAVNRGGGVCS